MWLVREEIDAFEFDYSSYITATELGPIQTCAEGEEKSQVPRLYGDFVIFNTQPSTLVAGGASHTLEVRCYWELPLQGATSGNLGKSVYIGHLAATSLASSVTLSTVSMESFKIHPGHIYNTGNLYPPQLYIRSTHDRTSGIVKVSYRVYSKDKP